MSSAFRTDHGMRPASAPIGRASASGLSGNGFGASAASGGGGMARLASSQGDLLASLRDPAAPHAEMLTMLLINNCLVELSRLASSRLSLAEYVQAVVGCLGQFAPMDQCALMITPEGLPPARSVLGDWPGEERDGEILVASATGRFELKDRMVALSPVLAEGRVCGYLGIGGAPDVLLDAGLVARCAEQITTVLGLLVETERLRRAAAAAHAIDLIASMDDAYGDKELADIAAALQMLPGARAARITLEVARFGGPIAVEAGVIAASEVPSNRVDALDRKGSLTVQIWWTGEPDHADSRSEEILDRLASTIARIEQTARLMEEVETDALTGVGNRRRASRAIAQARSRAERTGEEFAVLMMDLDRFKSVNDEFGHDVGDAVLCAFARVLETSVRGYDVVARWGGEEFLIVCPTTDVEGAEALARRTLEATPLACAEVLPEGRRQTVSIGIAVHRHPNTNPVELLRAADAALYEAKTSGRDRYVTSGGVRALTVR